METIETLGKYEIKRTLGRGAMGVVYEGWDPVIARRVAIKTVKIPDADDPETEDQLARFRREAQAAGRLTHPNIVGVFDYGETNDIAYIVMEYVDGPSVKSLLDKQERFALPDVMRIMEDLLAGLQFSHERGVVHRDIKPANVMLTTGGQAKIADFGIARIESSSMTQAGTVLGTPAYMSPEQFMGQVVDARSDIYSSGVLLYQLLTGERPFEGGLSAIMHKALNTEPPSPSQIAVTCPPAFDSVVRKAMAKRPEDRFQSATEFLLALRGALSGERTEEATMVAAAPIAARGSPSLAPASGGAPARGRSGMGLIAASALVLLLVVGGGAWFFLGRGPAPMQTAANRPAATAPAQPAGGNPPPAATNTGATTGTPPPAEPASASPPQSGALGSAQPAAPAAPAASPPPTAPPMQAASSGQPVQSSSGSGISAAAGPPATTPPPAEIASPMPQAAPPPAPAAGAGSGGTQLAAVSLASLRQQVAQIIAAQRCATLDGTVQDGGTIALSGLAGRNAADAVRQALAGVTSPGGVDWRVTSVDPYFCSALDLVHPIAGGTGAAGSRLGLTLAGGRMRLRDGEHILPHLVMPDFRGYLRVDYVAHDGGVMHLYPQVADPAHQLAADPSRVLAPGESLRLGQGSPGHPVWEVAEPYGTDMIIAIASSQPLLDRPRPGNIEQAGDYLTALQAAVDRARQRGVRLAGSAIVVDTLPK